jgi:hypothetical protein
MIFVWIVNAFKSEIVYPLLESETCHCHQPHWKRSLFLWDN